MMRQKTMREGRTMMERKQMKMEMEVGMMEMEMEMEMGKEISIRMQQ